MAEEQKKTVKKAPAKKAPAKKAAAKKAETPVEEATPVATEAPKKAPAKKAVKAEKKAPKVEEPAKPAVTEAKAFARDVRVTPRKVRLVVDLVRGKDVKDARHPRRHEQSCRRPGRETHPQRGRERRQQLPHGRQQALHRRDPSRRRAQNQALHPARQGLCLWHREAQREHPHHG